MAVETVSQESAGKRPVLTAWYTFSMYFVTHLLVFPLLPVAFLLAVLHKRTALQRLKKFVTGTLFDIIGQKVAVSGVIPAASDRHYLIVSNYAGTYVSFALLHAFPSASVVAHAFMSRMPFFRPVLASLGTVFVDPRRPLASRRAIDAALKAGCGDLVIFPEGGRSPDGRIGRFQRGFTYILRNSSLDLLPVTANGFYTLKPARRFHLDPSANLELIVHDPIRNAEIRQMADEEVIGLMKSRLADGYRP